MTVHGVNELLARLAKAAVVGEAAQRATTDVLGEQVAERMRATVAVDTGETRDTIEYADGVVSVGGAAQFLEYGTSQMDSQPFVRPAADTADDTAALDAGSAVLRAI